MALTLASWLHDWSPFIFRLPNGWGLRWYGVSYAAGFFAGWLMLRWAARRGMTPIPRERITDAIFSLIVGVVVGGRLGYVLVYEPSLLWTFSGEFPWWGVLMINHGGMASHGGMVGVLIAAAYVARTLRNEHGRRIVCPPLHVLDLAALACTPGLFFGRIANFINGELLGKVVAAPGQPAPWWAVRFPQERLEDHAPALTASQEHDLDALLARFAHPGQTTDEAFARVLGLMQEGPAATSRDIAGALRPLISARHPSQLYEALAEGLLVGFVLIVAWRVPRRPGFITALFMVTYGIVRFAIEAWWRLPDQHLATPRILELSRGQWLSAGMILGGGALLGWILRPGGAHAPKFGGWGSSRSAPV